MKHYNKICIMTIISVLSLSSCSIGGSEVTNTEPSGSTESETGESSAGQQQETQESKDAETSETTTMTLSTQKEALNIIDDNYRTYYEVFVGSFYDSNSDGMGDLQGLISKLDYINDNDETTETDLGCNGIWLMPIMPSPTYHKYDVTDYYDIDSQYGTLDDFKELIEACNQRDIKLIIDFVFNHTSSQHPWFVEALDYVKNLSDGEELDASTCPYAEYYNFSKDKKGKDGWYQVGSTEWYYEAQFTSTMPDLNLDSDAIREEIKKIADFWIDLGVGGFRLDAAKEYYSGNNSKNVELLRWFHEYVTSVDEDCYLVAEVWDSIGTIAQYYESGIDSVFNYYYGGPDGKIANLVNQISKNKAGKSLGKVMQSMQDTLFARNSAYIDASFLSNHDNDRCISYVGKDTNKMKLMAGINLCMSGSSFVYYGEEIGLAGSGRDENKRGPMYWSNTDTLGITTGPTGMEQQTYLYQPVDEQLKDSNSLLNYYIRAIRLRNENPELARGTVEILDGIEDGDLCGIRKTYNGESIYLLYNMSDQEKTLDLGSIQITFDRIKGALLVDEGQPTIQDKTITLPPYSIIVLK